MPPERPSRRNRSAAVARWLPPDRCRSEPVCARGRRSLSVFLWNETRGTTSITLSPSDLVFRCLRARAAEVDVIPDALVNEIRADLEDHIERPRSQGERNFPGKHEEDQRRGRRPQDSVADGFGDTPGMAFDAHSLDCTIPDGDYGDRSWLTP